MNGSASGDVFLIRADAELWLRTNRLAGTGLTNAHGVERTFNGESYVALSSLAPGVTFELDEQALELRLTAAPEMFAATRVVLQNDRPRNIEYGRASGFFLNYDALAQQGSSTSVTLEAGLNIKNALALTSYTRTSSGAIVRGLSSLTIDAPGTMVRYVVGDTIARATLLGSLPTVAGFSVGREFALDPYRLPYPLPAAAGSVSTPATADVYVNGTLVRRVQLPPGAFSLQRLPVVGGLGSVQVVVRDRVGRQQIFGGPYYFTSSLLDAGTHDFQYSVGTRREDQTDANPTYGPITGSFMHRFGVSTWLTLGARAEGDPDVVSGGPMLNLRIGRLGEIEAEGAVSGSGGVVDYAAAGSYAFTARYFTLSATAQWMGPHFATLDLAPSDDRNTLRTSGSASVTLGRASVTAFYSNNAVEPTTATPNAAVPVAFSAAETTDSPAPSSVTAERRAGLSLYLQFGPRVLTTVSAARVHSELATKGWAGFASLNILLGPRAVASIGVNQSGDGTTQGVVSVQKSLPLGTGVGYRVEAQTDSAGAQNGRAEFQWQGRHGLLSLREDSVQQQQSASAELAGSVVIAGGRLTLGRSITDGYAVVQVQDNPGVRVYVNNQLAGRTGRGGTIVVPNLLPYYANPVRIADEDIALEYQLDRTSALVAPPNRGPAVVKFGAVLFRGVSGHVVILSDGHRIVPAYGDATIDLAGKDPVTSPIGSDGAFYLENVPAGPQELRVDYRGESCRTTIDVPKDIRIAVDIGEVTCTAGQP